MSETLIEQYNVTLQNEKFDGLVAELVYAKLFGKAKPFNPDVIGGWYITPEHQQRLRAEEISDAVVERIQKNKNK